MKRLGYLSRDVEVVSINDAQYLVASCDSCGAIGMKELDNYKIFWFVTGKLTTRVESLGLVARRQCMTYTFFQDDELGY